jgi:hypothetical protein
MVATTTPAGEELLVYQLDAILASLDTIAKDIHTLVIRDTVYDPVTAATTSVLYSLADVSYIAWFNVSIVGAVFVAFLFDRFIR